MEKSEEKKEDKKNDSMKHEWRGTPAKKAVGIFYLPGIPLLTNLKLRMLCWMTNDDEQQSIKIILIKKYNNRRYACSSSEEYET